MKALVNGKSVELTEEQIKELEGVLIVNGVTEKQRLSAIENAIADLAVMLMGGISNG